MIPIPGFDIVIPEDPQVGDRVWIETEPGCEGEFDLHGIRPYTKGLVGFVEGIENYGHYKDHVYRVTLNLERRALHCWFKASELRGYKIKAGE